MNVKLDDVVVPVVVIDSQARPRIVYEKTRRSLHAVVALESRITLTKLESLEGLRAIEYKGKPYPVKRAARHMLKSCRSITDRAEEVLRELVKSPA